MPGRRVIAYAFHEHELEAAHQAIPKGQTTDGFVVGEADDATIERLRQFGLVVQEVDQAPTPIASMAGRSQTFAPGKPRRPIRAAPGAPSHI